MGKNVAPVFLKRAHGFEQDIEKDRWNNAQQDERKNPIGNRQGSRAYDRVVIFKPLP